MQSDYSNLQSNDAGDMKSSGGSSCNCSCGTVWSIVEIICGVATTLSGVLTVLGGAGADHIPGALVGVALIVAGVTIILYAFGVAVNAFVQKWMEFYTTFLGRGITFLLLGIIGWRGFSAVSEHSVCEQVLEHGPWHRKPSIFSHPTTQFFLILSIVEVVLGILYIILQFVPGVPPPEPICGGGGGGSVAPAS